MPSGTIIMPSGTIWPEFLPKLASVAPGASGAAGGSGTEALPGKLGVRTKNGEILDPTGRTSGAPSAPPGGPPESGPESLPVFGPHAVRRQEAAPDNGYITRYRAFRNVD